jgi:response regulator RpfG family c-di-GMP phosphodiesterase
VGARLRIEHEFSAGLIRYKSKTDRDYSHEEAQKRIPAESGKHFDPDVVAAFMAQSAEFIRIAREFSEEE